MHPTSLERTCPEHLSLTNLNLPRHLPHPQLLSNIRNHILASLCIDTYLGKHIS
jgi:hypothetical protein